MSEFEFSEPLLSVEQHIRLLALDRAINVASLSGYPKPVNPHDFILTLTKSFATYIQSNESL